MGFLTAKWPFFVAGPVLAVFMVFCMYLFNDNIGMGDTMTVLTEYGNDSVKARELVAPPKFNWQIGLLLGMLIGGFAGSLMCGRFKFQPVGDQSGILPNKVIKSAVFGFAGGFLVMLAIQLSGDSVWGHLAGAIQLSGSSWLFLCAMTATGVIVSVLWERRGSSNGKNGE